MKIILAIAMIACPTAAAAEVISSSANGFVIRQSIELPVAPGAAYERFARPAQWWNAGHTYSGNSANLSIDAKPGGCFCERLGSGGVEHLRVSYVDPGKRIVLSGGLGPLLFEAVAGTMDVKFEAAGAGTRVTMDYKTAGFASGGADTLAPLVDKVLAEQMKSYAASADQANR